MLYQYFCYMAEIHKTRQGSYPSEADFMRFVLHFIDLLLLLLQYSVLPPDLLLL